jgi:hypothetical protein
MRQGHTQAIRGFVCGAATATETANTGMNAAFAYGMRAEHDYTRKDAGARWGLRATLSPLSR